MLSTNSKVLAAGLLAALTSSVEAYWRMPCGGTLVTGRLDPIVSPGITSGHTHVVLGGNAFSANMNYDDTQKSTCTSCAIDGDFSNYWVANMYYREQNGTFTEVPVSGGTVYYQQRVSYPGKKLMAFPPGLRMLAGNPELRSYNKTLQQEAISHVCLNYAGGGPPQGPAFPTVPCPDGIRSQVYFPSCWDGKNLDSPDHQSHMSYPVGDHPDSGVCPDSHPNPLISIFYEFIFNTGGFKWYGSEQPFVLSMGDTTGYGFHGDFIMGWDPKILQNAVDNFVTQDAGQADNVYFNNYFQKPKVSGAQCSIPPMVDEQIHGNLPALPGCNPVTDTPVHVQNCAATKTVGVVTSQIYTDVTKTKGWQYIGCGADQYGNNALTGFMKDDPGMTVETCIDLCSGKGFNIAGLEYGSQCFCGSSLPASASPVPNVSGPCTKPCAGNNQQKCGNANALSLYTKCSGTCQNAVFGPAGSQGTVGTGDYGGDGVKNGPSNAGSTVAAPAPPASSASSASAPVVSAPATSASSLAPVPTTMVMSTLSKVVPVNPIATATSVTLVAKPAPTSGNSGSNTGSNTSVTLPSGWSAQGCYKDNVSPRSLNGITFAWWGKPITSSGCASYCASKGFSMAGTEFGSQCFCGNSMTKTSAVDASQCNMACAGAAGEKCGGAGTLSLFSKVGKPMMAKRSAHKHKRAAHNFDDSF